MIDCSKLLQSLFDGLFNHTLNVVDQQSETSGPILANSAHLNGDMCGE